MQPLLKKTITHNTNYSVDEYGNVYNNTTGKKLTGGDNGNGYKFVALWKNNKAKNNYRHRLVAQHFLQNPHNKPEVNHLDGNKENNHFSNLEWCTEEENTRHAFENGFNKNSDLCKKSAKERFSKTVLNVQNGIFYPSAKEAALSMNIKYYTLAAKLNGWNPNNTNFIYA